MNFQAHMSGQLSGQVNQSSGQMPRPPQQNETSFRTQMRNLSGQSIPSAHDAKITRVRHFIREKIYGILMRKQSQPNDITLKRCQALTRRLEEGLFKSATSLEEYVNLSTLEIRMHELVIKLHPTNHVPQNSQFIKTHTPVSTMIPTPGLQHNGNSSVMVSTAGDSTMLTAGADGSTSSSTPSTSRLMPAVNGPFSGTRDGSFHVAEGSLSNGYQQPPSSFPMKSGGNNMVVTQRPMTQMIPTPGLSGRNSQMPINVESSNNIGTLSSVDSSVVVSRQELQREAVGQNSQMIKNLGSEMRTLLQKRFPNGTLSNGLENMVNGTGSYDSYLTTSSFGASSISQLQPHDPLHQPIVEADSSVSGNFYDSGHPVGSLTNNNSNVNHVRLSSASRPSSLMKSQLNPLSSQSASYMRPHFDGHVKNLKILSSLSPTDSHSQSSMGSQQQQHRQPTELSQTSVSNEAFQSQLAYEAGTHGKFENGMECQNEIFLPQSSSGQIQYNSNGNLDRNPQLSSLTSGPQPVMAGKSTDEISGQPFGAHSEPLLHSHRQSDTDSLAANLSQEQHVQEEFRQMILRHEEAQCIDLSFEVSGNNAQIVAPGSVMDQPRLGDTGSLNAHRERQYRNQVRWLLFLCHARRCTGVCPESHCIIGKNLLKHLDSCKAMPCSYPRCAHTRRLFLHQRHCMDLNCPVCVPYKKFIHSHKKLCNRQDSDGPHHSVNGPLRSSETGEVKETRTPFEPALESPEIQPPLKRLKSELSSQSFTSKDGIMSVPKVSASPAPQSNNTPLQLKSEFSDVKVEISSSSNQNGTEIKNTTFDIASSQRLEDGSALKDISFLPNKEATKLEKDNVQLQIEEVPIEQGPGTKSVKPKIKGVSLIELFTPEQVKEHISGLRQWVGQSRAKVEKNQAMEQTMNENSCQLCAVERLSFEPPPIYCSPCGARIKRNAMYYVAGAGDTRHYFCIPCYNETRGDTITVDGKAIAKGRMEKKKNDEEIDEWWVQCDKCEAWQHQICALFNGRRNDGGQAEYTCPNCYMLEVERGERQPLPQSTVLGAKDLPGTSLSDHIELRLARRLKQERQERARSQGKTYNEVPGVDDVVVRVVSSVDKKLEVKSRFLEIFREENYPLEFPYKSKVVLLFQKIEGVEVCLFGMYVQEFGSECLPPNQRRVYLSYLDSVKYFRPEIKTVTGEALRTFVYHEILIGYLEYCKKRGFTSCYIWACPPLKGEDYILYCHPEIQKTPKSDKLREWYLAMLKKASNENIVVELTNLYDHFFLQTGESKAKVTAVRLPYFDGDYWPGAAEDMIHVINQEEEGRKVNKKGPTKKMMTKRALKASGHSDLSINASKDFLLMHKLGESIAPMKEDFIMVHLQHACTHCCMLMVSGNRWVCELCEKFQLCDRCYSEEKKRDDGERHPISQKDKHELKKIEIIDVPEDTKDKDDIVESEFFDTRQAFLSLCQGNHYQYDTLRRAKHSSMMVLYHLHNPTAPAFVTSCNKCHLDIETGQGWRCETCPDFDVCNACYQKDGCLDHPHKLTNHPNGADRDAQNKEARQLRVVQLRKMLELLVHASQCRSIHCPYPNCRKVKSLFRHGIQCRVRASAGCGLCKKMWYLLQLHARACKESACPVPRCRDLREHIRRSQQQSESRRRVAVMEMMRQRAKEVAGSG